VEKHQESCASSKEPRTKVYAALKANRVEPREIDRQAVERAENEGMTCLPGPAIIPHESTSCDLSATSVGLTSGHGASPQTLRREDSNAIPKR
jgi:hypothetical protein